MLDTKANKASVSSPWQKAVICFLVAVFLTPFNLFSVSLSDSPDDPLPPDSIPLGQQPAPPGAFVEEEEFTDEDGGRVVFHPTDSIPIAGEIILPSDTIVPQTSDDEWVKREIEFVPDPTRAVWLAALFPGLGQVYNRRYWKLPLVVGGYLGLGYATSWNNGMLRDYTRAYADIMDNDPTTKSYMDFFPSTVREEDLDKTWLTNLLQSRKNYFRRNRDLCIISMVGVYLLALVDAYVDASLAHFDISPDLSMEVYPTAIRDGRNPVPSIGLQWALNF